MEKLIHYLKIKGLDYYPYLNGAVVHYDNKTFFIKEVVTNKDGSIKKEGIVI